MTKEALNQVASFYHEYHPSFNKRHNENDDETSCLGRSIIPICRIDSSKMFYEGGIQISTNKKIKDYHGTQYQVLTSYLVSFHGLPT